MKVQCLNISKTFIFIAFACINVPNQILNNQFNSFVLVQSHKKTIVKCVEEVTNWSTVQKAFGGNWQNEKLSIEKHKSSAIYSHGTL